MKETSFDDDDDDDGDDDGDDDDYDITRMIYQRKFLSQVCERNLLW